MYPQLNPKHRTALIVRPKTTRKTLVFWQYETVQRSYVAGAVPSGFEGSRFISPVGKTSALTCEITGQFRLLWTNKAIGCIAS